MTIGERIKRRREELGMTQEELAKKCGYKSRSSVNKIELSRDLPLRKVKLMADALQTTPSDLMGWIEEMNELSEQMEIDSSNLKSVAAKQNYANIEQKQIELSRAIDKYLDTAKALMDVTKPEEKKTVGYREEIQELVKEARKSTKENVILATKMLKGLNNNVYESAPKTDVLKIDVDKTDENLLMIKGAVPGPKKVVIKKSNSKIG